MHPYRVSELNGKLSEPELSIEYSHLGGPACLPEAHPLPAEQLVCAQCGRKLMHILQYVLPDSTDALHKVLYVFLCNSGHFAETGRVLSCNVPVPVTGAAGAGAEPVKEQAGAAAHAAPHSGGSLLLTENADTGSLLASLSAPAGPKTPATATAGPRIRFSVRPSSAPAFDVCSTAVEEEVAEILSAEPPETRTADAPDDLPPQEDSDGRTPLEALQTAHPTGVLLLGHDRPTLVRLPPPVGTNVDAKDFVHEVDILPSVIAVLRLPERVANPRTDACAEFRSVALWARRTNAPGWHAGLALVAPEEPLELCAGSPPAGPGSPTLQSSPATAH